MSSAARGCATGRSTSSGSFPLPPTRSWRPPPHEPGTVNPALAGVALAVVVGGLIAGSARHARTAVLGLLIVLVATPFVAEPLPGMAPLAARILGAVLGAYVLWIA